MMNAVGMKTADQHERDGEQRAADLVHGLVSRLLGCAHAGRHVSALDILDHDDGVIDHDADGEDQPEQRQAC